MRVSLWSLTGCRFEASGKGQWMTRSLRVYRFSSFDSELEVDVFPGPGPELTGEQSGV